MGFETDISGVWVLERYDILFHIKTSISNMCIAIMRINNLTLEPFNTGERTPTLTETNLNFRIACIVSTFF